MSKPFSSFYDYLLPELPGCTAKMLDLHLLLVGREVCDCTGCWRETLAPIEAESERTDYPLVAPYAKTEVARVMRVTWGDRLQWSALEPQPCPAERPRFVPGQPPFELNPTMDTILLTEQPEGEIVLDVALRPALDATTLPDLLLKQHLEAVRTGVLSRLMAMGGKPWSNSALASDYSVNFYGALNHAGMTSQRGSTRAPLRTGKSKF